MNEDTITTITMQMVTEGKVKEAYNLLVAKKKELKEVESLYYNYLSCCAVLLNKREEALTWLEEAIREKGIFYEPEVFNDTDYDAIRDNERFKQCIILSTKRYEETKANAKSIFTWSEKTSNKIAIALHGNYQNNKHAKEQWRFLSDQNYQVEYLQSSIQAMTGLYKWSIENAGPKELEGSMVKCSTDKYSEQILCGFSAGCAVILNTILTKGINCSTIILQSPGLRAIEKSLDDIIKALTSSNIKVLLVCDTEDQACFPLSEKLYNDAVKAGINIKKEWTTGLGHRAPENLDEIVIDFLR